MKSEKSFVVTAENAELMKGWLLNRGGIAVWRSINMSNPGATWSTPAKAKDGTPMPKPNWQCANEPERIITDPGAVLVMEAKEVARFRVAVRPGANNPMVFKLTDASSARLRKVLAKHGPDAWHSFDYTQQQAIVYVPGKTTSMVVEEVSPMGTE